MSIGNNSAVDYLTETLRKLSYKPGWEIRLVRNPLYSGFDVVCFYEGYESEDAAFAPLWPEPEQVSRARERLAISIGKSVREKKRYKYLRHFDEYQLEHMNQEMMIKYIICETIKEAEMYEFNRWFKFEGTPIFENQEEKYNELPFRPFR
jgi:hypothetical protein